MSLRLAGFTNNIEHYFELDQRPDPISSIQVSDGLTAARVGDAITLGIGAGIQFQSSLSSEASLAVSNSNVVSLTSAGNIVLQPGSSAVQMTSTTPAITIQPLTNTDVMYVKGQLIQNAISGVANGSAAGIGPSFVGNMNDILLNGPISGSNTFNLQFSGSSIVAGSIFEFFLNPASITGSTLTMSYDSTAFATFTFPADAGKFVRVYALTASNFYAGSF